MLKVTVRDVKPTGKIVEGPNFEQGKLYRHSENEDWFYLVFKTRDEQDEGYLLKDACQSQAIRIDNNNGRISRTLYWPFDGRSYEEVEGMIDFATP